jgi:hypothetical protein
MLFCAVFLLLAIPSFGFSQQDGDHSMPQSSMPDMDGMDHHDMEPSTLIEEIEGHTSAGTTAEPDSTPVPMLMLRRGGWNLMFHGVAFLNDLQQSGPRGGDKLFSTNWLMPMAQKRLGRGEFTLRTMFSLEPATVTQRFYPELFQQGETAFGRPITDGQHPHDFFMELAALYDLRLGENTLLSFYAAPVGDPAMGPTAYAHRSSASEDPLATLGHHLQDSTHIASDVVTAGFTYKSVRLEASGFHGREPDEFRWNIDSGKLDSWSTRLTVQPGKNWSAQYSFAHLTSPEQLHPEEDVQRMTASVMHNHPLAAGHWATTLLWGRNHSLASHESSNGYLAESTLQFAHKNYVWGRVENVDRTTELLPVGFDESFLARVQAYSIGYDRDVKLVSWLATAVGAQATLYHAPAFLSAAYGEHPAGVVVFFRVRPQ